jgi:class 3 adenylate cyclase
MEQRCDLFGLDRPFFLQPHQRIKRRRGRRERRNMIFEHPFTARIRFNSGYCNAGNVGSADRTDYTIVGAEDPAAGHSIAEPGGVVISSETCALVSDVAVAHPLAQISMKGRSREVD